MELTLNFAEMRRFALLAALMAVGYLLVRAWNDDFSQRLPPAPASTSAPAAVGAAPVAGPSPAVDVPVVAGAKSEVPVLAGPATPSSTSGSSVLVEVVTDTLHVWIDTNGDVIKATLPRYPLGLERKDLPTVLLDSDSRHIYVAESGLIGANGPDARPTGRPTYRAAATHYALEPGRNELVVPLAFVDEAGVRYTKTYRFQRGRYELQLEMKVDNASASNWQGNMFVQLKRDGTTPEGGESGSALGPKPFLGIALTTAQSPYQKVDFEDVKAGQIDQPVTGGWIAILQHYFLVSWIAQPGTKNQYFGREGRDGTYHAIEGLGLARFAVEAFGPAEGLADRIGGRTGEDRHREQAGADDPQGKQPKRQIAGNRPQRPGRLRRAGDFGYAVGMQRRRSRDDDEQRCEVRETHADQRIGADTGQLAPGTARRNTERFDMAAVLFLDLLPGLPEKQIGADRRAENGDQRHGVRLVECEARHQGAPCRLTQRNAGNEHHRDIGKQRQRRPFEHADIAIIADKDFEDDTHQAEKESIEQHRSGHAPTQD